MARVCVTVPAILTVSIDKERGYRFISGYFLMIRRRSLCGILVQVTQRTSSVMVREMRIIWYCKNYRKMLVMSSINRNTRLFNVFKVSLNIHNGF